MTSILHSLHWHDLYRKGSAEFLKLSARERIIIAIAVLMIASFIFYSIYEPLQAMYDEQSTRLIEVERNAKTVVSMLERHTRLKARRDAIEEEYKQIEFKEGSLSHLENLVRNQQGVSPGFTIKEKEGQKSQFGESYEQSQFSVRFQSSNLNSLVELLKELVRGPKRMVLNRLEIQKSRLNDKLEVELEVTSLKRLR